MVMVVPPPTEPVFGETEVIVGFCEHFGLTTKLVQNGFNCGCVVHPVKYRVVFGLDGGGTAQPNTH